jgi:hypothetical protein
MEARKRILGRFRGQGATKATDSGNIARQNEGDTRLEVTRASRECGPRICGTPGCPGFRLPHSALRPSILILGVFAAWREILLFRVLFRIGSMGQIKGKTDKRDGRANV